VATVLLVPAYPLYKFMKKSRYRRIIYSFIFRRHGSVFPKFGETADDQQRDDFEISAFELKMSDEKLGTGAFAIVYKGRLRADCMAAKKFLARVKGEIGRTESAKEETSSSEHSAGEESVNEEGEMLDVAVKALHNLSDERAA